MAKNENNRFQIVLKEKTSGTAVSMILKDRTTGALYLVHENGYAGGITPLIDKSGKPVIDPTVDYANIGAGTGAPVNPVNTETGAKANEETSG